MKYFIISERGKVTPRRISGNCAPTSARSRSRSTAPATSRSSPSPLPAPDGRSANLERNRHGNHAQVILNSDVLNLGSSGELVRSARALPATTSRASSPSRRRPRRSTASITRRRSPSRRRRRTRRRWEPPPSPVSRSLARPVGEDDHLFGPVTAKEHRERREEGLPTSIAKKMHLADPLKSLGTFEIPVKLLTDVTATLRSKSSRVKHRPEDSQRELQSASRFRFCDQGSSARSIPGSEPGARPVDGARGELVDKLFMSWGR